MTRAVSPEPDLVLPAGRQALDTFRLALDCLPDASLLIDQAGKVVFANQAYQLLTGYPSSDIEGQPLCELVEPDGATAEPSRALCRSQHGFLSLSAIIRPLAGDLGKRLRLVRLEESSQRRSLVDELSAGLQLEGEFLARISHELRTPLTAVQEGVDVVLEGLTGPLNERQKEFLQLAKRNVQRLIRLVTDTLEFDRLKRGERSGPRERINLESLIRDCVAQYERAAVICAPDARDVWVEAELKRIQDVLDKLLLNAVRHSSNAQIAVSLRCANGGAIVEVADSGPGIPADKLTEIFGEFQQLSTGPGRTVGGVGLGLTIAKLIIEQHGGRIWAESEPGRGSRFCIFLKTCTVSAEETP